MKNVRVRFAPSPTGPLHLGSVRTALYNYLFAKKYKGNFILRIEDTDQNRIINGSEKYILNTLKWARIEPNEGFNYGGNYGPYRQSERITIYNKYVKYLIEKGYAYYAFDRYEDIENIRKSMNKQGIIFSYNASIRNKLNNSLCLTSKEVINNLNSKIPYVIRFKVPSSERIKIYDDIHGNISFKTDFIDDKILVKSNGIATYHLANVIDDHLMRISNVIRGEEWLSSLPLHVLLYRAFEWEIPNFAHLPLILNTKGKGKLSKRDADKSNFPIFPLKWKNINGYNEIGYFPEAFINMLALLGWNPGDQKEIFSLKELINKFSIEKINKSSARFNINKAIWFNKQYLQLKSVEEISFLFKKELNKRKIYVNNNYIKLVINNIKERVSFINEIWENSFYFFERPKNYDIKLINNFIINIYHLNEIKNIFKHIKIFSKDYIKTIIMDYINHNNLITKNIIQVLRLALVGNLQGIDIYLIMEIIGQIESIKRIEYICTFLSKKKMK
ncbi:MAG: glutamate--tRNA ligase [Candidatus Bostrichicola ureolyticus]|nr:MAG: glutamate--tRNA ligase [Candidatus Bostrichicola ureolyticus]